MGRSIFDNWFSVIIYKNIIKNNRKKNKQKAKKQPHKNSVPLSLYRIYKINSTNLQKMVEFLFVLI